MENVGNKMDVGFIGTSTTHPGATGALVTFASDDFDQLIAAIPIVTVTGSPQLTVAWADTVGGSYTVEKTFTLDNTYNGKVALLSILKPIKGFYQVAINLNSGTMKIALQPVTPIRYGARRAPVPPSGSTTITLTQVAGNS